MHRIETFVFVFVAAIVVGCASGDPPPRHAGGPADPAAPEAPIAASPFASSSATGAMTPIGSASGMPGMNHDGMDMPMPTGSAK